MGLGGHLTWTAVARELVNKSQNKNLKILPVEIIGNQAANVIQSEIFVNNPYFTTDTAASLRAMEISAEVIFKATKVDGIYSADPMIDDSATKFQELSYLDVLKKGLKVMDSTSVSLCMDNKLPMVIFNFRDKHSIKRVLLGEKLGTTVGVLK